MDTAQQPTTPTDDTVELYAKTHIFRHEANMVHFLSQPYQPTVFAGMDQFF